MTVASNDVQEGDFEPSDELALTMTDLRSGRLYPSFKGRSCMATNQMEDERALVVATAGPRPREVAQFVLTNIYPSLVDDQPLDLTVRGYIRREALTGVSVAIDAFKSHCGRPSKFKASGASRALRSEDFGDLDRYQGDRPDDECARLERGVKDRLCGGRYANYFRNPVAPAVRSLGQDVLYLTGTTTGIKGIRLAPGRGNDSASGVPSAVIRVTTAFRQYDQFPYSDSNVPCGARRVARVDGRGRKHLCS